MKDTKKTPVPLPGSGSKLKTKSEPTPVPTPKSKVSAKGALSQELVGSDDDSSTEEPPLPKPKTTIAVHRPNGAVKAKGPVKPKAAASAKVPPKKAAPKQVVTQAQAAELSSSEQTDDDDAPTRNVQTKLPGNEARASESGSDSSSDSSDDESLLDGASQSTPKPAQTYVHATHCNDATCMILILLQTSAIATCTTTPRRHPAGASLRSTQGFRCRAVQRQNYIEIRAHI
jgi:hypothetical protein